MFLGKLYSTYLEKVLRPKKPKNIRREVALLRRDCWYWRGIVGKEGDVCKEHLEGVDDKAHKVRMVPMCLLWQYWLVVQ